MTDIPATMRKMTSTAKADGTLEVRLSEVPVPQPGPGQLLVKVEAAPINPSDLALLISLADVSKATVSGTDELPVVTMPIPEFAQPMMKGRLDKPMPVGNEGAGLVVAAGDDAGKTMIGRRIAAAGGEMFAEYHVVPAAMSMPLADDATARDGASSFVNPMTALSMTEVMKRDGSKGLIHTAAASNLGQMLQRICKADGIPLINIVRKPEQQAILNDLGAAYTFNSSDENFMAALVGACSETGATIAFDAIGGGALAGQLVTAMEMAAAAKMSEYSRYGSDTYKHVYIYGRLDLSPTILPPSVGMAWGVGGFLLPHFLASVGNEVRMKMVGRVMSELKTTFASHYTAELSLADALKPENILAYNARKTGEKYLITPAR
ncbi:MAG: zinc-binding dehydrogenase [Pseudomonadota bacterium]